MVNIFAEWVVLGCRFEVGCGPYTGFEVRIRVVPKVDVRNVQRSEVNLSFVG